MKIVLVKIIILLALLGIVGGLSLVGEALGILGDVFYYGIITVFSIIPMLPTSIYDVLEQVIKEEWTFTSITWIDVTLVNLASIVPPAMFFTLAYAGFKIDGRLSAFLSFLIFLFILQMFSSILFWSILLSILVLLLLITIFKK